MTALDQIRLLVLGNPGISCADILNISGLRRTTVESILTRSVKKGEFVFCIGVQTAEAGRAPRLYTATEAMPLPPTVLDTPEKPNTPLYRQALASRIPLEQHWSRA